MEVERGGGCHMCILSTCRNEVASPGAEQSRGTEARGGSGQVRGFS